MKMRWEEPRIEVQKFIPNEYVAACYNISCNVREGYYETNGEPGYKAGGKGDELIVELDVEQHIMEFPECRMTVL